MSSTVEGSEVELRAHVLQAFANAVAERGYTEFMASFNPLAYRPEIYSVYRFNADPRVRAVIDFLLLRKSVRAEGLDEALGDSWRCLLELSLAELDARGWATMQGLALQYHYGILFFTDAGMSRDPNVYFGDDSIALFPRIYVTPAQTALDLCSGSGIQAMQLARSAGSVAAVEINPRARRVLSVNAALNSQEHKVNIYGGSLFNELPEGVRFDVVTANPPLVPFPDSVRYPFVGHGGADGLAITSNILEGLRERLTARGRAHIIGLTLSNGARLVTEDQFRQIAAECELDITLTLIAHLPLSESSFWMRGLVGTALPVAGKSRTAIDSAFADVLSKYGATHLASCYIFARCGSGRFVYQNFARTNKDLWFVSG
ncbi:MAG: methyltransferase [Candidatus Eremiobacteraeota bacterium]|nr:methyltransferase [Candidatus Eremiobacteraeota bacterium]